MDRRVVRSGAVILVAGLVLFAAASMLHPPTVNPWDPTEALAEAAQLMWMVDHLALLVAVIAVHLGLFILHTILVKSGRFQWSHVAFACGAASMTLWVTVFVVELTGWPLLAQAVAAWFGSAADMPLGLTVGLGPAGVVSLVVRGVWATSLTLGYAAAFLLGLAVLLWSIDITFSGALPRPLGRFGIVVGLVTIVGIPVAVAMIRLALWLLVPIAGLIGAWLLAVAWAMWRSPAGKMA